MSGTGPAVGSISWVDLTVPDAPGVRDFYAAVTGWRPSPVAMGEYSDFCMNEPASGKSVAGVCHARGENADLPAQWRGCISRWRRWFSSHGPAAKGILRALLGPQDDERGGTARRKSRPLLSS